MTVIDIEDSAAGLYDPSRKDFDGTATLTKRDRGALRFVLGRMLYLPSSVSAFGRVGGSADDGPAVDGIPVSTVADVVKVLARMAAVLAESSSRHAASDSELRALRADVAAMRRVLGVSP